MRSQQRNRMSIFSLALIVLISGCSHSLPYDPDFNVDYEGKPQGPIFYSKGGLVFYGKAAESLYNDIKARPEETKVGNFLKPADESPVNLQCVKLKSKKMESGWFYSCAISAQELTKTKLNQ
jgi:hypothetical protein